MEDAAKRAWLSEISSSSHTQMDVARALCLFSILALRTTRAFYTDDGPVAQLDPAAFGKRVPGDGIWLVEFYAPWCGHCKSLAPTWEEVGRALKGVIKVGAVDADTHKSLAGEFNIQGFPTIKLIASGKNGKRKVIDFNGGRSAREIVEWATGQAQRLVLQRLGGKASPGPGGSKKAPPSSQEGLYSPNSAVVSLTDSSFHSEVGGQDLWLVEFYAPWCGHCKALKSDWEQLASEVSGKAKIGAVDCTAEQATCQHGEQREDARWLIELDFGQCWMVRHRVRIIELGSDQFEFGVQGYPTIKYFGPDKDSPSDYQGGRDSASLASFILGEWRKIQPPPEAMELVDQYTFEEHCSGTDAKPAQKLCFIAFLPDILDSGAEGRNAYIKVMTRLAAKYSERAFSYLWAPGRVQSVLEAAVGVGGYGYPAFVALNPKDAKYAALRESFSFEHAVDFIESLRQGYERISAIAGGSLPPIAESSPWDGREGQAVEEDEFSLEDLMNEEL